jgi:hypothetical protein
MDTWFDPTGTLSPEDALIDLRVPWLRDGETPPLGENVAADVDPLHSDETPPRTHPGSPLAAHPDCPLFVKHLTYDPAPCGGLRGGMRERANDYQRSVVADPVDWINRFGPWPRREMRHPSAVTAYRLIAHYARPLERGPDDRDKLLAEAVLYFESKSDRTHLQRWAETADFTANGLLRLLYLYSHVTYAPDPAHAEVIEPLIPCRLQDEAKKQLLGFKYFGDEPARRPEKDPDKDPQNEAVYWSENHQLLYATAEYLAGQLMPTERFQPTLHWRLKPADRAPGDCQPPIEHPWQVATDPAWGMTGTDRMARAYPRLVRWLDHRLMFGFSEWNSPVYYEFDIAALLNLVDFCDDRAVADKAAIALDLVLFDLARFSGWGQAGATSGRAYPSHKYAGWNATTANSLQILFGPWDVDTAHEDVLESWRIEAFEARRTEYLDNVRAKAFEAAEDAGFGHPDQEADAVRDREMTCYDNANPVAFERARRPPIGKTWVVADSPGAHSLASSNRYCVPDLFQAYAVNPETPWFERSRVSIGFEEGEHDYGIGFSAERDVLAWWSRGGFGAAQTIVGSRDLADAWDVEKKEPFSEIPGLFILPDPLLEAGAALMRVESEGSCLTAANLALWREKGVSLSSVQKFRFGQVGRQAHIWQATLGPYAGVWSTYPAAKSAEYDTDGPTWWSGNAAQPRVVQLDDALICIHDSNLISYTNATYGYRSHAWFPVPMFDEAFEVRPDPEDEEGRSVVTDLHTRVAQVRADRAINANRGGVWFFGRAKDAYVGLFSAKSSTHLKTDGRWAGREILCEDRVNVFICQVGSSDRYTTFDNFMAECCGAKIYVAKGVYWPSDPFVDIDCSYQIPRGRNLWLKLEDRWPILDGGTPLRDEEFPRWQNPWNLVPWRTRVYSLGGPTFGGPSRTLYHDCKTGERSGTGL